MKKKALSLILAACLCFSNIPVLAYGTEAVLSSAETESDGGQEKSNGTDAAAESPESAEKTGAAEDSQGSAGETGTTDEDSQESMEETGADAESQDNPAEAEKVEGLDEVTAEAQTVSGSGTLLVAEDETIYLTTSSASGTNYVWTGGTSSGTLTITGDIASEIYIALGGYSGYVLTITADEDVSVPGITVSNYKGSYAQYKYTVQLATTNTDGVDISIDSFNLSGPDDGKLIVGSNVHLSVYYLGLGASGGANSYIELSENASLTYTYTEDIISAFSGQYITADDGATLYFWC
ncbi:MAG: hypothetical protein LUC90_08150 [Lachnospiraceae bacterium]|nr:hypothetical protein [Lachnospiraceae bacterium]